MSWLYSRALVEEYSEGICSDGEPSVQSNGSPMPQAYLCSDKMMGFSRLSRFGMTFRLLTESRGKALLMSYLEGFPVRTSLHLEKETALTVKDQVCGEKWRGSWVKYDHATSLWRTHQCSLLGGLTEFSETWPSWGLMRDGECWELGILEPPMPAKESGWWHPTPVRSDYKGANLRGSKQRESQLKEWLHVRFSQGRKTTYPNPWFLERVMGWPIGWTELRPLETDKFQQWQQQHGEFLGDQHADRKSA
jgi:hypothetical protein